MTWRQVIMALLTVAQLMGCNLDQRACIGSTCAPDISAPAK